MSSENLEVTDGPPIKKLEVFISYSRQDIEFVDKLQSSLVSRGIEAFVDREDIEKGEDWWKRIEQLISEVDTVIYVLSPASVLSEICQQEVDYADSLNKRLIPVIVSDLHGHAVPDSLARINYIFFYENLASGVSGDFDEAIQQLINVLETDISWIREHTRLGVLAKRWEMRGKSRDLVLRGTELADAETWLSKQPKNAPNLTNAHHEYISGSRRASIRRNRRTVRLSLIVAVIALGLAGLAYWQWGEAVKNEQHAVAQEKLAKENEQRAEERSSLLAINAAEGLTESGATDEAIALLLEAGSFFEKRQVPDKLLMELERVIEQGQKKRSYRFSHDSVALFIDNAYYVFDPETRKVSRLGAGGSIAKVGEYDGRVRAADLLADKKSMIIVGADLSVSKLDLSTTTSHRLGEIAWPNPPYEPSYREDRIFISGDGLILLYGENLDSDFVVVHHSNLNRTVSMSSEDYLLNFHLIPGSTTSGRYYIAGTFLDHAEVFTIDPDFQSISRADTEDHRWRPRFMCGHDLSHGVKANARTTIDKLIVENLLVEDADVERKCFRFTPTQALLRDPSITGSGGYLPEYLYVEISKEPIKLSEYLIDKFEMEYIDEIRFADFYPGKSLLAAVSDTEIIIFDRDQVLHIIQTQIIAESVGFFSENELAVVERTQESMQLTVYHLINSDVDHIDANIQTNDGVQYLHHGNCAGGTERDTTWTITLQDGVHITLFPEITNNYGLADTKNEIIIENAGRRISIPLPGEELECVEFSADWQEMLILMDEVVKIYDFEAVRKNGTTDNAELGAIKTANPSTSAFFVGKENDVITAHRNGEVIRWYFQVKGRQSLKKVIYHSTKPVYYAEPDANGNRLLIIEKGDSGIRGYLYSVEAQEEWYELGDEYKWLYLAFMNHDYFEYGSQPHTTRRKIPHLKSLMVVAEDVWSSYCRLDNESKSITESTCWPSQFRY